MRRRADVSAAAELCSWRFWLAPGESPDGELSVAFGERGRIVIGFARVAFTVHAGIRSGSGSAHPGGAVPAPAAQDASHSGAGSGGVRARIGSDCGPG